MRSYKICRKVKTFSCSYASCFLWLKYWSDTLMEKQIGSFREEDAEENIWT